MKRAHRATLCVWVVAMVSGATGIIHGAETDAYAERSKDLQEALSKIKAVLPEGWEAEFVCERRHQSALVATRTKKVAAMLPAAINPSAKDVEDESEDAVERTFEETVQLRFELQPFMTQEEFAQDCERNRVKARRRMNAFKGLEKNGMIRGFRGGGPFPPSELHPKTDAEKEQVRRYAVLWVETAIKLLPTHYHKGVAYRFVDSMDQMFIVEPGASKEVNSVREKVLAALTAYELPKDEEKKP